MAVGMGTAGESTPEEIVCGGALRDPLGRLRRSMCAAAKQSLITKPDFSLHCIGVMPESQVAMADSEERTTASENEQKKRVPVWFGTVGAAMI